MRLRGMICVCYSLAGRLDLICKRLLHRINNVRQRIGMARFITQFASEGKHQDSRFMSVDEDFSVIGIESADEIIFLIGRGSDILGISLHNRILCALVPCLIHL
jgi:hypothetical protein